jgi:hypothetical protein
MEAKRVLCRCLYENIRDPPDGGANERDQAPSYRKALVITQSQSRTIRLRLIL